MAVVVNFEHEYPLVEDPYHKFCRNCGVFLNTARMLQERRFSCIGCKVAVDQAKILSPVQTSKIEFKAKEEVTKGPKKASNEDALTDRTCGNCGNKQMAYKTMQTRSADEGQTVFFYCLECKHNEVEYS
ncbi:DNA-directed RNA polymerase I subunit RPA12-like [Symsagittifera roscoffensis]|uniref:DNA-directed RNA polymerase I subunit RPA12-like n=1 Tax=Symsagittifera roscoffensis TaxID=84072 RepID=UPI00307BEC0C